MRLSGSSNVQKNEECTQKKRNFSANTTMQKGRLSDSSAADNEVVIFSHVLVYHSWVVCHLSEGIPLELLKSVLNALLPSIVVCLSSLHPTYTTRVCMLGEQQWKIEILDSLPTSQTMFYTLFFHQLSSCSLHKKHTIPLLPFPMSMAASMHRKHS